MKGAAPAPIVLTVGHSTRSLEAFIALLQAHEVTCVADVRTVPRSRHNPQFNKTSLPRALKKAGMGYVHLPGLGGLRHTLSDSPNMGWHNASFRGYADYMQTPAFAQGLDELIRLAGESRIVLLCAEAVPWRCHRSLIADALLVRGIRTEHIMSPTRRQLHKLTAFAKVRGAKLTYPAETAREAPKPAAASRTRARQARPPTPARRRSAISTKLKAVNPRKPGSKPALRSKRRRQKDGKPRGSALRATKRSNEAADET